MKIATAAAVIAVSFPAAALCKTLPDGVEAMIRAAAAKHDPAIFKSVVGLARESNPESLAELDALVSGLEPQTEPTPEVAAIAPPPPPPPVAPPEPPKAVAAAKPKFFKGNVELGGNQLSGTNEVLGLYGAADLVHANGRWRHRILAKGDYQETDGRKTADRYTIGYEPKYSLSGARYAYGLAQVEHDAALYDQRYTLGGGIGVGSVEEGKLRVALDIGPALRLTESATENSSTVSARGSLNVRWILNDHLTISQENSLFSDRDNTTAKSQTAIDSRLMGPLKARVSYNIQYESKPTSGQPEQITATRASVLYNF